MGFRLGGSLSDDDRGWRPPSNSARPSSCPPTPTHFQEALHLIFSFWLLVRILSLQPISLRQLPISRAAPLRRYNTRASPRCPHLTTASSLLPARDGRRLCCDDGFRRVWQEGAGQEGSRADSREARQDQTTDGSESTTSPPRTCLELDHHFDRHRSPLATCRPHRPCEATYVHALWAGSLLRGPVFAG